jgi:hypothetical protein
LGLFSPLLTVGMACPSEITYCSTSSSSFPWWTTHARYGGPLSTHTLINCKCCNPSVFALPYVGNKQMHEDSILRQRHQRTDWELWLEVSWRGEPLSSATWKAPMPTKGRLKSPADNRGELKLCWPVEAAPKKAAKSTQRLELH